MLSIAAPQAQASGSDTIPGVSISPKASTETRAIAAANVEAAQATATLCGSGYTLFTATRLPDASRLGTLFLYNKSGGNCAVFDNNTTSAKWMKLKLCENLVDAKCNEDSGTFSQYAGPVFLTSPAAWCGKVTALMKNSSSSSSYLINFVDYATPCG
ncbi:hypothetical protein AB0J38_11550 [Streptomyces sp. NPDC050095]|uniref:hypothetical protein n=1 Tax=unclassified Streptomyces TaxID=2593676 RepID=UPI003435935E